MQYTCQSPYSGSVTVGFFANPSLGYSGVPAGDASSGHCARRLSETATRVSGVRAEVFNALTSSRLATQLSATKCFDAVKYINGTQVSCSMTEGRGCG
jgi:hypothetical protein